MGVAEAFALASGWINKMSLRFDMQRTEAFIRRRGDALAAAVAGIDKMFDRVANLAR